LIGATFDDIEGHLKVISVQVVIAAAIWLARLRHSSRKRAKQGKKRKKSRFLDFQKKLKKT